MIKKKVKNKIQLDLTGTEGNAYNVLGLASRLSKQLELNTVEILKDMKSSDYEHLIKVFDKHFGDFVILYR